MIRCYDCGKTLRPEDAIRRDVEVGNARTFGSHANAPTPSGSGYSTSSYGTRYTGRVDLCRRCDREREQQNLSLSDLLRSIDWRIILGTLGAGVALFIVSIGFLWLLTRIFR